MQEYWEHIRTITGEIDVYDVFSLLVMAVIQYKSCIHWCQKCAQVESWGVCVQAMLAESRLWAWKHREGDARSHLARATPLATAGSCLRHPSSM